VPRHRAVRQLLDALGLALAGARPESVLPLPVRSRRRLFSADRVW
jgi:hypothetical protein